MSIAKIAAVALSVIVTGLASQANATVFTYDLTDTPHAGYNDGAFYEFTNADPRYDTYSFEQNGADVKLRFDDAANTAQIYGVGYNLNTNETANFNLFYNEAILTGNTLSLGDMDTVGSVAGETVLGKGFNLTLVGDTLSGSGWLVDTTGGHFGDFHLAGTKTPNGPCTGIGCNNNEVPAPGPLSLVGAMALLGAWRRRRAIAG